MRWRDVRFEKPTREDCDKEGVILGMYEDGTYRTFYAGCYKSLAAWMPLSELPKFDRVPDPPDGWRFVKYGEPVDLRAKVWAAGIGWDERVSQNMPYKDHHTYIVPIDPPKPEKRYRPFASAAEFEPYRDRWLKNGSSVRRVDHYNDQGVNGMAWESLLRNRTFEDGSPCGVEVSE